MGVIITGKKKVIGGQITIFIIFGIVILFLVALLYTFIGNAKREQLTIAVEKSSLIKTEFVPLQKYTEVCIEHASIIAAFYIGEHGGYYETPASFVNYNGNIVAKAYQYNDSMGENLLIGLSEVEENYATFAEDRIIDCVNDFKVFKEMGHEIKYNSPELTVKIEKEYIIVNTKFKIESQLGDISAKFYDFTPVRVPLRLGRYYEVADYLATEAVKDPYYLKASYLFDLYKTEDIEYHVPYVPAEMAYAYFLLDDRNNAEYRRLISAYNNNKKFAFIFAMKFE